MASFIGEIVAYDEGVEPWPCHQGPLNQYFLANDIGDEKKVPALVSLVGDSAYRLLRDLFSQDLPST